MPNMSVEEYAKYVMQNLGCATRGNAVKIVDRLGEGNDYDFLEFVGNVEKYVSANLSSSNPSSEKSLLIILAVNSARVRYMSNNARYNKRMVIDNFILDLWEAVNGKKG